MGRWSPSRTQLRVSVPCDSQDGQLSMYGGPRGKEAGQRQESEEEGQEEQEERSEVRGFVITGAVP